MRYSTTASALAALSVHVIPSIAHSWVEQMNVISSNGSFTGNPGYARNNTLRTAPGFSDLTMVHILPGDGQPSIEEKRDIESRQASNMTVDTLDIKPTDPMCKKTQQIPMQSDGSPRLQAQPGAYIALRYQENGHVTLPQNQAGKPPNRGTVYIYGTTQPQQNEIFLNIFNVWNSDGTGGDKRGKLLATQNFDDGQCYQTNDGNISTARQKQYPHAATQLTGTNLFCQNDFILPSDAPVGKPYTLYWVWDWPTLPNVDPNLPKGKAEIYTTCMDVDIVAGGNNPKRDNLAARDAQAQSPDLNNAAVPSYMKAMIEGGASLASPQPSATGSASPVAAAAPTASNAPAQAPVSSALTPQSPPAPVVQSVESQAASSFIAYLSSAVSAAAHNTVTVTAAAAAGSAASGSSVQPSSTVTISNPSSTQTVFSASIPPVSAAPSIPASSLNIQPPVISSTSPSPTPAAASSSPTLKTFQGTATPLPAYQNSTQPAVNPRGCKASTCKVQKRSRILAAAHRH